MVRWLFLQPSDHTQTAVRLMITPVSPLLHLLNWVSYAIISWIQVYGRKICDQSLLRIPKEILFGPCHKGLLNQWRVLEERIIYHASSFAGQGYGNNRSTGMQTFLLKDDGTPDFEQLIP